jgi:hypothetical protein
MIDVQLRSGVKRENQRVNLWRLELGSEVQLQGVRLAIEDEILTAHGDDVGTRGQRVFRIGSAGRDWAYAARTQRENLIVFRYVAAPAIVQDKGVVIDYPDGVGGQTGLHRARKMFGLERITTEQLRNERGRK